MQIQNNRLKDLPKEGLPRERLIKLGPKSLSNVELLSIILGSGTQKENVLRLSERLLSKYTLKALSQLGISGLKNLNGIGEAKACKVISAFELGNRLGNFTDSSKIFINDASDVVKLAGTEIQHLEKEHFIAIYLNSRKRVLKSETIFIGGLNASFIHPREVFKRAISENAAGIIVLHNHPSGDPTPSEEDIEVTKQLSEAGKILGIGLLDHIIIGENKYASFREAGLL